MRIFIIVADVAVPNCVTKNEVALEVEQTLGHDIVFKNSWSSGRHFTYTSSNKKWAVGCFHGTGKELIKKAYGDSELSGRCYEAIVRAVKEIEKARCNALGGAE